jgi:hypothetical protein
MKRKDREENVHNPKKSIKKKVLIISDLDDKIIINIFSQFMGFEPEDWIFYSRIHDLVDTNYAIYKNDGIGSILTTTKREFDRLSEGGYMLLNSPLHYNNIFLKETQKITRNLTYEIGLYKSDDIKNEVVDLIIRCSNSSDLTIQGDVDYFLKLFDQKQPLIYNFIRLDESLRNISMVCKKWRNLIFDKKMKMIMLGILSDFMRNLVLPTIKTIDSGFESSLIYRVEVKIQEKSNKNMDKKNNKLTILTIHPDMTQKIFAELNNISNKVIDTMAEALRKIDDSIINDDLSMTKDLVLMDNGIGKQINDDLENLYLPYEWNALKLKNVMIPILGIPFTVEYRLGYFYNFSSERTKYVQSQKGRLRFSLDFGFNVFFQYTGPLGHLLKIFHKIEKKKQKSIKKHVKLRGDSISYALVCKQWNDMMHDYEHIKNSVNVVSVFLKEFAIPILQSKLHNLALSKNRYPVIIDFNVQ